MADLMSSAFVNRTVKKTGGVPVSYSGVDGYGHEELPPHMAFEDPDLASGKPSVVVAAGYFPRIGVDRVEGLTGIRGTDIQVGDHVWRISRALKASEDGKMILLVLTHPD